MAPLLTYIPKVPFRKVLKTTQTHFVKNGGNIRISNSRQDREFGRFIKISQTMEKDEESSTLLSNMFFKFCMFLLSSFIL